MSRIIREFKKGVLRSFKSVSRVESVMGPGFPGRFRKLVGRTRVFQGVSCGFQNRYKRFHRISWQLGVALISEEFQGRSRSSQRISNGLREISGRFRSSQF